MIRLVAIVAFALAAAAIDGYAHADELSVAVDNRSRPTRCAEEDNVYLRLRSPEVTGFRIEAVHPAYIDRLATDQTTPDFVHCDFAKPSSPTPASRFTPRQMTLYRDADTELVGFTFADFWRTNRVPVRVGAREESDIHMLQLWLRAGDQFEEVLVLYPTDGYWRARPLTPANLPSMSAYGSSFLIGPVEERERPLVDIRDVIFDPAQRAFTLHFASGGEGHLRVAALDRHRIALDVALDRAVADAPFAAIRSMFVTDDNADMAQVTWRSGNGAVPQSLPVLEFSQATAVALRAERIVPSRHNASAPDLAFGDFANTARR